MFADIDFFKFNKENDEQMFINVKKFSMSDLLLKTNSEKFLKRAHNNDSNISIIISAFD